MANKLATLKLLLSYPGPSGDAVTPPAIQVDAPFLSETVGTIDVPDGTAAAHDYGVPFGAIATEATLAIVWNRTANGVNPGVDLGVKINGAAAESHRIPPGGVAVIVGTPVKAGGAPKLTSLHLFTKDVAQVGDGAIAYWLFG